MFIRSRVISKKLNWNEKFMITKEMVNKQLKKKDNQMKYTKLNPK